MMMIVVVLLDQQLRKCVVKHPAHTIVKEPTIALNPNTHQERLMTGANLLNLQPTLASIAAKWVTLPRTVQDPSKLGIVFVRSALRSLKKIRTRLIIQTVKTARRPTRKMDTSLMTHIKVVRLKRSK